MGDTLIIIQQGTPVIVEDVATYIGAGTAGTVGGCRRLVFPSGILDGAGDPVALAPLIYAISTTGRCLNPTRTMNVDNDALPHPTTAAVKTLGSTRVVRFEEQVEDVIATEVWEARGGASMTTAFFRLIYEYLLNARFIPGGGPTYIQWEPRDRTDKVFLVELLSLSAGGEGESQFDLADIMGGDVMAPAPDFDTVFSRVSPVPTGLVDVDVRLRMRIISEA